MVLTSDEKEQTLKKALSMIMEICPEKAFFGNSAGPAVIMTDNCDELRNALKLIFPESYLLLCSFHMLQQVWRWLYDRTHNISAEDRVVIMKRFRHILYCEQTQEMEQEYGKFLNCKILKKYVNARLYFDDLFNSKEEWALCYRSGSIIRGSNTNNYVEAQFLIIKDSILKRQRQFNVNMLLDKLFSEFEDHFKVKLLSIADCTFDGIYSQRFFGISKTEKLGKYKFCQTVLFNGDTSDYV